uniref:Uncharacterized protein n=1 Tax=Peronospora matthiolae TaxID=2874970 RepID=A0AAV1UWN4_9STRA
MDVSAAGMFDQMTQIDRFIPTQVQVTHLNFRGRVHERKSRGKSSVTDNTGRSHRRLTTPRPEAVVCKARQSVVVPIECNVDRQAGETSASKPTSHEGDLLDPNGNGTVTQEAPVTPETLPEHRRSRYSHKQQ